MNTLFALCEMCYHCYIGLNAVFYVIYTHNMPSQNEKKVNSPKPSADPIIEAKLFCVFIRQNKYFKNCTQNHGDLSNNGIIWALLPFGN